MLDAKISIEHVRRPAYLSAPSLLFVCRGRATAKYDRCRDGK